MLRCVSSWDSLQIFALSWSKNNNCHRGATCMHYLKHYRCRERSIHWMVFHFLYCESVTLSVLPSERLDHQSPGRMCKCGKAVFTLHLQLAFSFQQEGVRGSRSYCVVSHMINWLLSFLLFPGHVNFVRKMTFHRAQIYNSTKLDWVYSPFIIWTCQAVIISTFRHVVHAEKLNLCLLQYKCRFL